ncbi:MAG: LysR family transcriptional regulator [Rhodococcus sp. (in: high G+C Gram-positive bacteria)]|uniref:LysR family transcriptional regulator n=1 Tax=Rhodococcus sp. TaxID=1831 RepID=UPI003BB66782
MAEDAHLDLYRLRQFVAVAERLNITRAAEDLHLTQQAVSMAIKNLERDIGVVLLDRSGRRLSLTPAGAELLSGAILLLDASRSLVRTTRAANRRTGERLVVGYTPALTSDEVFDLIAPVRQTFPDASITARQMFPDELVPALKAGDIAVGLRRGATTPRDVSASVFAYSPLRVALAVTHRFADRPSIALHELADDCLMLWGPPGESFYAEFLMSLCRRAGFEPQVAINRIQGTAPTSAVVDTDCFAFVTAEPGHYHRGQAVVIVVEDEPMAPVQAMWLPHTISRLRQVLLDGNVR